MKAEIILSSAEAAIGNLRNGCNEVAIDWLNEIIEHCKNEIAINNNKSKGGNIEVTRYKTALKTLNNSVKEVFKEVKTLDDNTMAFTNGYIAYMGNKIDGLPESKSKEYPDINKFFEAPKLTDGETVLLSDLKTQLAYAKAEKKAIDSKQTKGKSLYEITEKGYYKIKNASGTLTYLNLEYVIDCLILCGGNQAVMFAGNNPFEIVSMEGKYGKCIICAINANRCKKTA